MEKNYFEEYKKSIIEHYKIEKTGKNSHYLRNPSLAKLRDLCIIKMRDNNSADDLASFRLYFSFDFTIENANNLNLQVNMNKFKPISNFFKGISILTDDKGLNLAAILVDFQNRPYNKFSKSYIQEEASTSGQSEPTNEGTSTTKDPVFVALPIENKKNTLLKTNGIKIASGCVIIAMFFLGVHYFMKGEECMEWVNDHYEVVDCDVPNESGDRYINAKEEDLFIADFKKISPCNTLSFKDKNGNACLWYGKSLTGEMEFFNKLALHPETKKSLKEVSTHIFNTYIKGEPCE
ncbi:hypothetical protein [Flavobacterium sp.]|uniref:hypothetical protein n=1 Tax=Flavobacterium sp. TaxID=239 RepID=UPI004047382E